MTYTQDIRMLVQDYLQGLALPAKQIPGIVQFYSAVRTAATTLLVTGEGRRPTFSLRTLCRALKVAARNPCGSVRRSLLEAFRWQLFYILNTLMLLEVLSYGIILCLSPQPCLPD